MPENKSDDAPNNQSSVHSLFGTSKELERKGIELDYGAFKITVARAGGSNQRFRKQQDQVMKQYGRAINSGAMSSEEATKLDMELYSKTVVLGWEGVTDEQGKVIPFSQKACLELFYKYPDLFTDLSRTASNLRIFLEDVKEEELGN